MAECTSGSDIGCSDAKTAYFPKLEQIRPKTRTTDSKKETMKLKTDEKVNQERIKIINQVLFKIYTYAKAYTYTKHFLFYFC
jgi:hypothetical protein